MGNVTEVRAVLFKNASLPIEVTPAGILALPAHEMLLVTMLETTVNLPPPVQAVLSTINPFHLGGSPARLNPVAPPVTYAVAPSDRLKKASEPTDGALPKNVIDTRSPFSANA